ncbi:glycerol-3-phosphate dehydrogenase/oxidase [Paenibacillus cymbidii]|uniref:glycerol-3-phosphate dehydrogenase/oxidase n=1 Tax=Paenibacillus cymbidii TaxID=1639034 RepID=UPI001A9B3262
MKTTHRPFAAASRPALLRAMATAELDLLVIGGGITGAGIALDASARGMNIGLVDKADFGSGTSSRSTKLVHGGLRYLKQGEVRLVREVGRERAILHRNAPHLVKPVPMLLPIYKGGTYGYWASSIGLSIYDWLAGVKRKERRRMLGAAETAKREPLLRRDGLRGGGLYVEYRTDDARLTLDTLKTAVRQGAKAVNYAEAVGLLKEGGRVVGLRVRDRIGGETYDIRAKTIVNAAGPWVDGLREMDGSLQGKRLFLTKGVHLVVHAERLPVRQAAYFDTPDGRMIFVIPRDGITYIGTTDTAYSGDTDRPTATAGDRDYLLRAVNDMFPQTRLGPEDVISAWAGLRPLIYEEGKGPSELSRKDEVFESASGFITIAGGKLTGFRKMAEKVVDFVARRLAGGAGSARAACSTDRITISGGGAETAGESYETACAKLLAAGVQQGVSRETMLDWIGLYGTNASRLLAYWLEAGQQRVPERKQPLYAQLRYATEEEMTATAADFLRLRTGWTYFQPDRAREAVEDVLAFMSERFGWDETQLSLQREETERLFRAIK